MKWVGIYLFLGFLFKLHFWREPNNQLSRLQSGPYMEELLVKRKEDFKIRGQSKIERMNGYKRNEAE